MLLLIVGSNVLLFSHLLTATPPVELRDEHVSDVLWLLTRYEPKACYHTHDETILCLSVLCLCVCEEFKGLRINVLTKKILKIIILICRHIKEERSCVHVMAFNIPIEKQWELSKHGYHTAASYFLTSGKSTLSN